MGGNDRDASPALTFEILAKCSTTRARASRLTMPHGATLTPVFMPVATQATIKGLTPQQVADLGITLILNNTFHLAHATEVLDAAGGSHSFQGWHGNLLTDSGGFQLVSLLKFSKMTEEGVIMQSPFDPTKTIVLSPEESMRIQHSIGADIIMQLDDVIATTSPDAARMEEAMLRSVRWLDRAIEYHEKQGKHKTQNLFAIIQGGLDPDLRTRCLKAMVERSDHVPGYAVGGLSGGEAKDEFWKVVSLCTSLLPEDKPRYCMGVGFAEDLLVCVALGVDMADCVFPTRTARFGVALTFDGPMNLALRKYQEDWNVIDSECTCPTCLQGEGMSRATLNRMVSKSTSAAHAVTLHNIAYQFKLMMGAHYAILEDRLPQYLQDFFLRFYKSHALYPQWAVDALRSVNVDLMANAPEGVQPAQDAKAVWDDAEIKRS